MIPINDQIFIRDHIPIERLASRRILITGGSGFIGHWLDTLGPEGPIIRTLNQQQYEYGRWDYADWDYIIHLANVSPRRVIQCAKRCKAGVLFSSSGAVYDQKPGQYALDKLQAEHELLDSIPDVKIARMFCFAGAHMKNHFALVNFIYDALSGGPIRIRGDNVIRSYMYAADMAVYLWRILLLGIPGSIYEVGSPYAVNMLLLANEIASNFNPMPYLIEDRIFGPDPRPVYIPHKGELLRTREAVGLDHYELTPFNEAIKKTIQFYKIEIEGAL